MGATAPQPFRSTDYGEVVAAPVEGPGAPVVVYEFIARLQVAHTMSEIADRPTGPGLHPAAFANLESAIQDSLPRIAHIARGYDDDLADRIEGGVNGEGGYFATISAAQELVGWIRSADRNSSPGPLYEPLSAQRPLLPLDHMHPWVSLRAAGLWTDQHRESAFAVVASDIFEVHLPDKLRVPATEPEQLVNLAFGKNHRRLKIPAYPAPGEDQDNAYQAARKLGLVCGTLLKLSMDGPDVVREEDTLLEELAMLSRFARLVDEG